MNPQRTSLVIPATSPRTLVVSALTALLAAGGVMTGPTTERPVGPVVLTASTAARPTLTLARSEVRVSATTTVSGTGFVACAPRDDPDGVRPGSPITLAWDIPRKLPTISAARRDGTFRSPPITVPANARPGRHTITATCGSGTSIRASATLVVLSAPDIRSPTIRLGRGEAKSGVTVAVSGSGFNCGTGRPVTLTWGDPGRRPGVSREGTFTGAITVPGNVAPGPHRITATCTGSEPDGGAFTRTASTVLRVLTPPITPDPITPDPITPEPNTPEPITAKPDAPSTEMPTVDPPGPRDDPVANTVAAIGTGMGTLLLLGLIIAWAALQKRSSSSASRMSIVHVAASGPAPRISVRPLRPGRSHAVRVESRQNAGTCTLRALGGGKSCRFTHR
jgi:hypothetical protein